MRGGSGARTVLRELTFLRAGVVGFGVDCYVTSLAKLLMESEDDNLQPGRADYQEPQVVRTWWRPIAKPAPELEQRTR